MLTRQEREQAVLDLYNQGKTIHEIARELRMSFRDIGAILRREEEKGERQKKQLENNTTIADSHRSLSLSTQTYELFSQGKTPIDVAIELDLGERQVSKYYMEYWKLKGMYKLNIIHDELKDDITYFAKLYRLTKAAGMSAEHVVQLLNIANYDLPALEDKFKKLQENVDHLESKELDASIDLESLKSEIQNAKQALEHCRLSYQKEVSKTLQLQGQNMGLERLLREFKNNNRGYIKIQFAARQAVKGALSDKRQLLKFALYSIIESWHANPTKFSSLIQCMSPAPSISKSTMINHAAGINYHFLSNYNQNSYTENLMEIIVNGAASLYDKMLMDFTNETMTNVTISSDSDLLPSVVYLDKQLTMHKRLSF